MIIIATPQEFSIFSPTEERVYRRYRLQGQRFEEIAVDLKISVVRVRRVWNEAMKKIRAHRELTENPQYLLHRGKDVLRSESGYGQLAAPAAALQTVPEIDEPADQSLMSLYEPGIRVRIDAELSMEQDGQERKIVVPAGTEGRVDEVYDQESPPFCVVTFLYGGLDMQASIAFDNLAPL